MTGLCFASCLVMFLADVNRGYTDVHLLLGFFMQVKMFAFFNCAGYEPLAFEVLVMLELFLECFALNWILGFHGAMEYVMD